MKYIFTLFQVLLISFWSFAQTTIIFSEDFEGSIYPPADWSLIDNDADGRNWEHRTDTYTGNRLASSKSYDNGALSPYNLIITPLISLGEYSADSEITLAFRIAATGMNYYAEHYKLVLSTSGNSFGNINDGIIL